MKRPIIVLTPARMKMEAPFENGEYNYTNSYNTDAILRNGGLPVLPPLLNEEQALELMEHADGLMMTGGADIDPARYGEIKLDCCGDIEYARDASDVALMKAALKLKKPILCICRGMQLANVAFGGSMYQDIPTQLNNDVKHSDYANYSKAVHDVKIVEGTPLHKLLGKDVISTNALHHQGVKDIAPDVKPMGYTEDGLLESWYYDKNDRWIRAYQWHPEMMTDYPEHMKLIEDFINQCRK